MNCNGTDRDVALELVTALDTCKTLVESINDALYAPHITVQPTDYTGELEQTATFSVTADHVKEYQWQFSYNQGESWSTSSASGNKTDTLSIQITEARLAHIYRCKITGLDGSVIYTTTAKMIVPQG